MNTLHKVPASAVKLDSLKLRVETADKKVRLTKKLFRIFSYLLNNIGKKCSYEEIIAHAWGTHTFVDRRTLYVHIRELRKAFGDEAICNVRKYGYRIGEHIEFR